MNRKAEERYADIIGLPHHVSTRHPQMSRVDRAAQFSPFAALTGHDAAIAETARITDERPLLDEPTKWAISDLLQQAAATPDIQLHITYFIPDPRKSGGSYAETCGSIKRLEPTGRLIHLSDGSRIPIDDVVEVVRV